MSLFRVVIDALPTTIDIYTRRAIALAVVNALRKRGIE